VSQWPTSNCSGWRLTRRVVRDHETGGTEPGEMPNVQAYIWCDIRMMDGFMVVLVVTSSRLR
jgi:hypothetical protein